MTAYGTAPAIAAAKNPSLFSLIPLASVALHTWIGVSHQLASRLKSRRYWRSLCIQKPDDAPKTRDRRRAIRVLIGRRPWSRLLVSSNERRIDSANDSTEMLRSRRMSAMVSPGAETQSGWNSWLVFILGIAIILGAGRDLLVWAHLADIFVYVSATVITLDCWISDAPPTMNTDHGGWIG